MKLKFPLVAIFVAAAPLAAAVELNTDALKSMQEEGMKIVEESEGGRPYKIGQGLCLDYAGAVMLVKKCDNSATQKWRFDDKGRLAASDGRCVAGNAQLQKCGGGSGQQWQLDNRKRLANGDNQCLEVQGSNVAAGAKVHTTACSKSANQVWK